MVVHGVPDGLGGRGREPEPVFGSPHRDRGELAAVRSMLRQVIALTDEAPALPDDQLRARLVDLARTARPGVSPWLMTRVSPPRPRLAIG
jgi:hypothetical protein